ncbi:MAG TPA: hypothetical protein H9727_01745 [Candidatus Borkfalkia avistercoris]|uniref:Uncharacterized protein n=1 Tax=Candidatus Borkfalkia avistercoris TaxID=2838504 RepID=A0A9D2A8I8_9FIRM|nr:hypothetical protein [Candidatus Borkfalkia avistercoris]
MKSPPADVICSVAGTLVTVKICAADCAEVSLAVVNTCCVAAPFNAVPLSVNDKRLVSGSEAFC